MKAFPFIIESEKVAEPGMDLRDYFACHAMQAFIVKGVIPAEGLNKKEALVNMAYEAADAMMIERQK
jgi:hypothetical protein